MHLTAARNSHVFSLDADFLFKPEFYAFQARKFKRKLFIQKTDLDGQQRTLQTQIMQKLHAMFECLSNRTDFIKLFWPQSNMKLK